MTNKLTQEQIKKAKDALITLGMEAVAYCERHCFDPAYAHKAKENIKTIESALEAYELHLECEDDLTLVYMKGFEDGKQSVDKTADVEAVLDQMRAYIDEHTSFAEQPNETAKDAYIYHLYKIAEKGIIDYNMEDKL